MKLDDRRRGIIDLLMETGSASVDELSFRFGVSRMTIHRDLDDLERDGLLRKLRGGASLQSDAQFESDFRYRQRQAVPEKRRIAALAAQFVEPGQTVMVDDSSTAGNLTRHLVDLRPLTVITNNLSVVQDLADEGGITVIAIGGQYSKKFHGFFGLPAEEALRSLRADIAFVSTSAIDGTSAFHQDQEVVQTKRLMIAGARRRYLLADHSKFGRTALHFMAPLAVFDAVVTGGEPPQEVRAALEAEGVLLKVADEGELL